MEKRRNVLEKFRRGVLNMGNLWKLDLRHTIKEHLEG